MTKTEQINMLVNQIGDLIRKQSESVLFEYPAIKLYIAGKPVDIDSALWKDGQLTIRVYDEGMPI